MNKKPVSISELFFDLIFVYVLAQIGHTVQHIGPQLWTLESLGKHFMLFLVFFVIWVYRTLLVNRYFNQKWYQYIFVFIDMFLVLVLSQSIHEDFQATFDQFVLSTTLLFLSITIQYAIVLFTTTNGNALRLAVVYGTGLLISSLFAVISTFLDEGMNFVVYFISIIIVATYPLFFINISRKQPLYFDHFQERLCLFVILLFGEGIIGVIHLLEGSIISSYSIMYFALIVLLFITYVIHYKVVTKQEVKTTGFIACYSHLFLIFSLNMIFLLTNYLLTNNIVGSTVIFVLIASIFIYMFMLMINNRIYGNTHILKPMLLTVLITILMGIIALFIDSKLPTIILVVTYVLFILYVLFQSVLHHIRIKDIL